VAEQVRRVLQLEEVLQNLHLTRQLLEGESHLDTTDRSLLQEHYLQRTREIAASYPQIHALRVRIEKQLELKTQIAHLTKDSQGPLASGGSVDLQAPVLRLQIYRLLVLALVQRLETLYKNPGTSFPEGAGQQMAKLDLIGV
jgi:hypothetical protein